MCAGAPGRRLRPAVFGFFSLTDEIKRGSFIVNTAPRKNRDSSLDTTAQTPSPTAVTTLRVPGR